jgi:hypothetical protein
MIPENLRQGEVIRTRSLNVSMGKKRWDDVRSTYQAKKGFHFVCVVLGIEKEADGEMNTDQAMEAIGWTKKPGAGKMP